MVVAKVFRRVSPLAITLTRPIFFVLESFPGKIPFTTASYTGNALPALRKEADYLSRITFWMTSRSRVRRFARTAALREMPWVTQGAMRIYRRWEVRATEPRCARRGSARAIWLAAAHGLNAAIRDVIVLMPLIALHILTAPVRSSLGRDRRGFEKTACGVMANRKSVGSLL